MIDDAIFLTGAQRSGTTLLDRLLGAQPGISILSQPFPLLFVEAKRAFLRSLGADDRYPFGHLFAETRYDGARLAEFLRQWRIGSAELADVFARMEGYSGQYTRFAEVDLAGIEPAGDFAAVVNHLQHVLARTPDARWFGSKETTCEEMVPYLLDRGFRCAMILRDPRDMVASLNHGRGKEYGGALKPTWFNVRSWRKSVAYALALEGLPGFHWCRYEDLAADPLQTLTQVCETLSLDPPSTLDPGWGGNSSHVERSGIDDRSVAAHRHLLPRTVAEAIEAATLPELQLLGYETTMTRADAIQAIETFREPYPMTRTGMEGDEANITNARVEIERLERIASSSNPESIPWFLFERVHTRLRAAFRP